MANRPINKGAPDALFSLHRIPYLLVLALFVALTQMWVNAYKPATGAQNEILNQYYEAEAGKNAFRQATIQDEILNLYYEAEARKNALRQPQSAPASAEDSVVASSSSPASPSQAVNLPQRRSSTGAVSRPLRSNARLPIPRSAALSNQAACGEQGARLNHQSDCRTR